MKKAPGNNFCHTSGSGVLDELQSLDVGIFLSNVLNECCDILENAYRFRS